MITDADRAAAEKFATPYSSDTENAYDWVKNAYLAGKLDERAKVDELVRALEEAVEMVGSMPACGLGVTETYEKWNSILKQFSGRSG